MFTSAPLPRFETGPALLMAGLREFHERPTAHLTIPAQWARFRELTPLPGQQGLVTYGIVCQFDDVTQRFEYMCAAAVADFVALPLGLGRLRLPKARYAVFRHAGPPDDLRPTWQRIWQHWFPTSGLQTANSPDFEQYTPDAITGEVTVEIWFPVQEIPE